METTSNHIDYSSNGNNISEVLCTYSEEEKQQNEINRENAKHIFAPEFIPFYPAIQRDYNLSQTETLLYGFIRFYMSNSGNKFYFTNNQLSEILGVSDNTINIAINKLSKLKLIDKGSKIRAGGGTIRFIRKVRLSENSHPDYQKTDTHSIRKLIPNKNKINENKINNNIYSLPEKPAKSETDIQKVVNYYFSVREWDYNDPGNKIIYSRYVKTAKQILELAGSAEYAINAIKIVNNWANVCEIDWSLETVIKKWLDLDKLPQVKEKKLTYNGNKVYKSNNKYYVIMPDGDHKLFAGNTNELIYV